MDILKRNNVSVRGTGPTALLFAHGFGCDRNMWRFVAPAFEDQYRAVLFDQVGAGGSDLNAYYQKNTAHFKVTPPTSSKSAAHSN